MKPPQPNRLLRAARERRHLTRDGLAEAAALWLARRDAKGRDVAFDANHLGKIERGVIERPRTHYIAALCAVLESTEAELGFDHSWRATPEDVDRKAFLQAAFGTGAGALIARHFPDHDASDLLASIATPTAHYRRMSGYVSTTELTPAVEAHLRLATSVITNLLPTRDGFAVLTDAAVLAAYIGRDRDDAGSARRHYALAVASAERAQQPMLTACTLLARGTFALESGEPGQALSLFQHARREIEGTAGAPVAAHALLASFHATAHAELGDQTDSLAELRRAQSLTGRASEPSWPWVFTFDASKAAWYEASTLARLDDLGPAQIAFAAAAPNLAPKALAEARTQHARVLAHTGHVDEARALAEEALAVAIRYGSDRIVQKVRSLRAELSLATPEAADLDAALACCT